MPKPISEDLRKKFFELHDKGFNFSEIAQITGSSSGTVSAYINGTTTGQQKKERFLKSVTLDVDYETAAQLSKLSEMWNTQRGVVIRTLIDWGMEGLQPNEKKAVEEAAKSVTHGTV